MARDRSKLQAFQLADELALLVYRETRLIGFADADVRRQLRRAVVSVPANIAEGCGRRSRADYARFLDIALGSASEADYLLELCGHLELVSAPALERCRTCSNRTLRALQRLLDAVRALPDA